MSFRLTSRFLAAPQASRRSIKRNPTSAGPRPARPGPRRGGQTCEPAARLCSGQRRRWHPRAGPGGTAARAAEPPRGRGGASGAGGAARRCAAHGAVAALPAVPVPHGTADRRREAGCERRAQAAAASRRPRLGGADPAGAGTLGAVGDPPAGFAGQGGRVWRLWWHRGAPPTRGRAAGGSRRGHPESVRRLLPTLFYGFSGHGIGQHIAALIIPPPVLVAPYDL